MRYRWLRVALLVASAAALASFGSVGDAVHPSTVPAPGYVAGSYACYATCVLPSDIVTGDFNGDGWNDLAVSCAATGNVAFYLSDPYGIAPGVFAGPSFPPGVNPLPQAWKMAVTGASVRVLVNPGFPGTFNNPLAATATPAAAALGGALPPGTILMESAGDLDHDGRADDIITGAPGAVTVWSFPDAGLPLVAGPLPITGAVLAIGVGDMNGDAWTDVIAITTAGLFAAYNAQYVSNPPAFGPFVLISALGPIGIAQPTAIGVGDFNNDGLSDLVVVGNNVVGSMSMGAARVLLNAQATPGAVFNLSPAGTPMGTWGFNAVDVVVADFDGNGRDDFAVLNSDSTTVTMFLTNALGGLLPDGRATTERCLSRDDLREDILNIDFRLFKLELQCGFHPVAMTAGDYDFNGKIDIAVAHLSATAEVCPQNPSCIEIVFDPACGFHAPRKTDVPNQLEHWQIPGVTKAGEATSCPACKEAACATENVAPETGIGVEGGSGN